MTSRPLGSVYFSNFSSGIRGGISVAVVAVKRVTEHKVMASDNMATPDLVVGDSIASVYPQ
jgi:hypothetical protein